GEGGGGGGSGRERGDGRGRVWLVAGCAVEETDPRQCTLLRARPERPRDGCTAEQCDELAPLHSITSLARGRNDSGIVKPSVLAVTPPAPCVRDNSGPPPP